MTRAEQKLNKAVKILTDEYNKALSDKYVQKPMAYALYQVWKHFDEKEKGKK